MPERITHAEFRRRLIAQGVSSNYHHAFRCPVCKTVQSAASLIAAGAGDSYESVTNHLAVSCVGRFAGAKKHHDEGCGHSLKDFFPRNELVVISSYGNMWPSFAVASPEEAKVLEARNRELASHG